MPEPDISGVLCPLVTPFDGDTVDVESLASLTEWVIDAGVDGVVPCGTTGEFASLSESEYRTVVETVSDATDGRVPLVVGTADTSVAGVRERLELADSLGADAALCTQPYFHSGPTPEGNRRFLERVADGSPLPIVLYNIPACTGHALDPGTVERLSDLDRIIGLKDSGGDFDYFLELLRRTDDEFRLLEGYDRHYVSGVHAGSDGGINALSNVLPGVFADIRDAAFGGATRDALEREQETVSPLFDRCLEYGFASVAKAGLASRGVIASADVRPPLTPLPEDAAAAVERLVSDAG